MPSIGSILGGAATNDAAEQLFVWGVLYGLLSAVFEPVTTDITQDMWENAVKVGLHRALSPELLASMVVRGWMDESDASNEAAKAGVNDGDFKRMISNAGNPVSPEEAAVALRRKLMPETSPPGSASFHNAIVEGNLAPQWEEVIKGLAHSIPTPADVLQAHLEAQIPDGVDPQALYQAVGGVTDDPANGVNWFDLMFNTRGSAPTPNEAAIMAKRGIIPWGDGSDGGPVIQGPGTISFMQAFLEGPWRNKWEPYWREMSNYLPPPRTVVAMLRSGALDTASAAILLKKEGLTPDLVAAYIADATHHKTATTKQLNVSAVEQLYLDKLVDEPTAHDLLVQLGYVPSEADLLLKSAALRQTMSELNRNTARIGSYYTSYKIDEATARTMLNSLGLPAAQVDQLIQGWTIDRQANVKRLTPAQVTGAFHWGVLTEAQAMAALEADGYTPFDAWVLLSERQHTPLPNPPAPGPAPVR
jgi:hypothetical protein